jgi:hypothetical protein
MLYTLIGNGNANKKEVISSLNSLRDAADDFGLIIAEEEFPSDTLEHILGWVEKNEIYYEAVLHPDGDMTQGLLYAQAAETYTSRKTLLKAVQITPARKGEGEDCAVLILSDDLENDESVLAAVERAIETGMPVYDLGNQMVEITFEEVPEEETVSEPLETPTFEDFHIDIQIPEEDIEFTREDLAELNMVELKAMVQSRGVIPRDMRSKDSMIDALMGTASVMLEEVASATLVQEPVQEYDTKSSTPVGKFYLVKIDADGKAEMRFLPAEKAALVY